MPAHLPDEVAYLRIFKGAPLSILMAMTLMDLTVDVRLLCALTGYQPEQVEAGLQLLLKYKFVQPDRIYKGWVLSSMYALMLFDDERTRRMN